MSKLRIVILFTLFLWASQGSGQTPREYGEECSAESPCYSRDILNPLRCEINEGESTGICRCLDWMGYHERLKRCTGHLDATCTLRETEIGKHLITCSDFCHCSPLRTSDGAATENGTCVCDADAQMFYTGYGCNLSYGSTRCTRDEDCDTSSSLACRNGKCVCRDEEFQEHYSDEKRCKSLAGGQCNDDGECGHELVCAENKCRCVRPRIADIDKHCKLDFDQACTSNSDCHGMFICMAGICQCPPGHSDELYNGRCVILAGNICASSSNPYNLACTDNAVCNNGVCTCNPNFRADNGKCAGLYGSDCNALSCHGEEHLTCSASERICTCQENFMYSPGYKVCQGLIGQSCQPGDDLHCVGSSICVGGFCGCASGQEPSEDKTRCIDGDSGGGGDGCNCNCNCNCQPAECTRHKEL